MKFLIFTVLIAVVNSSLPVEKTCGDIKCPDHHFCSPIDHTCRPCEQICDRNASNYDHTRCEAGCQDYLHDHVYLRRNSTNFSELATKDEIESLRVLLYIVICTTIPTLIFIIAFGCIKFMGAWERRKRQNKKKTIVSSVIYNNKHGKEHQAKVIENNNENKRRSMRMEREPSESTLPDYSYDNPNMSHSPVNTV
ncbi:unnamed protein product [Allacma fusca]|uniref:Uncharacterized protein n=1 Tax=Allacma fusca TaxID=39272 RepID=A0A8J2LGJ1_9HEXA|nr:unnamed protein product [Allacma fusca]